MSFFGLTHFGPPKVFEHTLLKKKDLSAYTDEQYREAFLKCDYKREGKISIDQLRVLLSYVYNGAPPEGDVRLLTKLLDKPGLEVVMMDVEQMLVAIHEAADLRREIIQESTANEYSSNNILREKLHKHTRMRFGPHEKFIKPVVTSQDIGWYTPAKVELGQRKPNKSCEETLYASEMVKSGIYF